MLRLVVSVTILDKMKNQYMRKSLRIRDIGHKVEENGMRWLGHIVRRGEDHITNNIRQFKVGGKIKRGRTKNIWTSCNIKTTPRSVGKGLGNDDDDESNF